MPWSKSGCKDMTDEECADFLFAYIHNIQETIQNKKFYKDTLKYIVGSIMIESEFRFISKNAIEICKKNQINPVPTKDYDELGLRIEHTIPVSLIADYILKLPKEDITVRKINDFVKAIRGTSLITKEEDNLLNKNKLRSKLPQGMTIDMLLENNPTIMFDIRYKFVGIK